MKKVTLIGAGGVGTRIIPLSINMFDLTVVDGDKFERKNLARQIMGRREIGKNKADAMRDMYGVKSIPEYLTDIEQLKDAEFVICAPDNHKCRLIALLAADEYDFGLILAGNEEYTANAMYYQSRYRNTSTDPRVRYPDILVGADREIGETCLEKIDDKPQTGLANSMAADFALALALYWTGDLPDDDTLAEYAPFDFMWSRSSVSTIRGYTND